MQPVSAGGVRSGAASLDRLVGAGEQSRTMAIRLLGEFGDAAPSRDHVSLSNSEQRLLSTYPPLGCDPSATINIFESRTTIWIRLWCGMVACGNPAAS